MVSVKLLTLMAKPESAEQFLTVVTEARLVGDDVRSYATAPILTEISISGVYLLKKGVKRDEK